MGSWTRYCLGCLILILAFSVFSALLILPTILWKPRELQILVGSIFDQVPEDTSDHHWGYGVLQKIKMLLPKDWGKKYADCDLNIQSPINIETSRVINNSLLVPMEYINYEARPANDVWTVSNNGHTVQFSAEFIEVPQLTGGGLVEGQYDFRQLHFHWGGNDSRGSEHAIDGKQYPLEVHLVHINSANSSGPYKIAVLGVLFELSTKDENEASVNDLEPMDMISSTVLTVRRFGTKTVRLPGFTLSQLLPSQPQYFRYYGSLTTPPCSQHLQWTLMQHPIPITRLQLQRFRRILSGHAHATNGHVETADTNHEDSHNEADGERIVDNYRPYQEVSGRVVNYFSG
ncbi:hypothetical protein RvY_13109 [Ramazzottius varieornatus]|uniref:Carbonic anhydrase n=1 Tax=Ramazzottius varieornatus TaxID=947166 RepID=A0A1D1VUC0_RAMVA|nr:hypothetical protein RvY_13109 [Ramazzottius varieornatus]